MENIKEHILDWIEKVKEPLISLNGMSTCPFAKLIKQAPDIIETHISAITPPDHEDFDIVIYVITNKISTKELDQYTKFYNKFFPRLIFLPDHPDSDIISGNESYSSNGKYTLLLCQPKEKLRHAREKLVKSDYYSHWNDEYLQKIMGDDHGLLD